MKKVFVICVVIAMLLTMMVPVCADPGGFVSSPSNNMAPELVSGNNESDGCHAIIIITAYADRHKISADDRKNIEDAYAQIVGHPNLKDLYSPIATLADTFGIDVEDLAVSDLFNASYIGCSDHAGHGNFEIIIKSETIKNFACLLQYRRGEWSIVENAELINNGEHLKFRVKELGAFAVVVNAGDTPIVQPDDPTVDPGEQPGNANY